MAVRSGHPRLDTSRISGGSAVFPGMERPVALRPRLTTGLPLSQCKNEQRTEQQPTPSGVCLSLHRASFAGRGPIPCQVP